MHELHKDFRLDGKVINDSDGEAKAKAFGLI